MQKHVIILSSFGVITQVHIQDSVLINELSDIKSDLCLTPHYPNVGATIRYYAT